MINELKRLSKEAVFFTTEQFGTSVTLQFCIREVFGSNLGRHTGYPEFFFVVFLSLSKQIPGQCLNQATTASLQIPSNSTVCIPTTELRTITIEIRKYNYLLFCLLYSTIHVSNTVSLFYSKKVWRQSHYELR
jgi:hypothetical protein